MKPYLKPLKKDFGIFVPLIAMVFFGFTFWILTHENRLSEKPKALDHERMEAVPFEGDPELKGALARAEKRMGLAGARHIQCSSPAQNASQAELSAAFFSERAIPILPKCPTVGGEFAVWLLRLGPGGLEIGYIGQGKAQSGEARKKALEVASYIETVLDQESENEKFRILESQTGARVLDLEAQAAKKRLELDEKLKGE